MESKCFSMDLILSSGHFSRSSILKARYNGVLDVFSFLMGFSFCFILIKKIRFLIQQERKGFRSKFFFFAIFYYNLRFGSTQYSFVIIWNLDSPYISFCYILRFGSTPYFEVRVPTPHILFCYNLRFGSTPYQFYLNSSKMLISDYTIYGLRIFRSKTGTVRYSYERKIP